MKREVKRRESEAGGCGNPSEAKEKKEKRERKRRKKEKRKEREKKKKPTVKPAEQTHKIIKQKGTNDNQRTVPRCSILPVQFMLSLPTPPREQRLRVPNTPFFFSDCLGDGFDSRPLVIPVASPLLPSLLSLKPYHSRFPRMTRVGTRTTDLTAGRARPGTH